MNFNQRKENFISSSKLWYQGWCWITFISFVFQRSFPSFRCKFLNLLAEFLILNVHEIFKNILSTQGPKKRLGEFFLVKSLIVVNLKEGRLVQPLWKTVWSFLKNLTIELPYELAVPLLGIHTSGKKKKTLIQKYKWTPVFIAVLFTIAKLRKQPQCPSTDEWMKEMWYIYSVESYSAIK